MISLFLDRKFVRFLLVGLLNTGFSYSVYAIFIFFHAPYIVAGIFQAIFGILFSFKTIGALVFKNKSNRLILRFCLGYFFLSGFYIGGLKLMHIISDNDYFNGLVVLVPYILLSFIINKKFIFNYEN